MHSGVDILVCGSPLGYTSSQQRQTSNVSVVNFLNNYYIKSQEDDMQEEFFISGKFEACQG